MDMDSTIANLTRQLNHAEDTLDKYSFKPIYAGGRGAQDFDRFLSSILRGGADMKWYQHLAIILLLIGAINWLVVIINYNVADVQGGAFGGVVPDLIGDFFKLPPDGINKKAGTAKDGYLKGAQTTQAIVYALVGLSVIVGISMLAKLNYSESRSTLAMVALVVVIIGAVNWLITLINMYAFKSLDGGSSGYVPDIVFLFSKFAGKDTMKTSPFPGGGTMKPSDDTVKAVTITQQVIYAIVALCAFVLIALRFKNPAIFNM